MKYKANSYHVVVDLKPWFDNGYRFTKLHIYEELGGQMAFGTIDLETNGSQNSLDLYEKQFTGVLSISDEGEYANKTGLIYDEINIFITERFRERNYVTLNFICVKDKAFCYKPHTSVQTDLEGALKALFPGKVDIRLSSDIQDKSLKYFQTRETGQSFLNRLCLGFAKGTTFGYSWDGLLVKGIIGKDHLGNDENDPKLVMVEGASVEQLDQISRKYSYDLYQMPKNVWTEKDPDTNIDYSDKKPLNVVVQQKNSDFSYVGTKYEPLIENAKYNSAYLSSNLFHHFRVIIHEMPGYKLGDVVLYKRTSEVVGGVKVPYSKFLVISNELFLATDGTDYVDESGQKFSWTTKLLGLEEDGKIAIGNDKDPSDEEGEK